MEEEQEEGKVVMLMVNDNGFKKVACWFYDRLLREWGIIGAEIYVS